jgi:Histidine kinase-, DNA gyrase B-, and HSP90-like ATPase
MKIVEVKVQNDHIQTLCRAKKPILAVGELIWNGLDADANIVAVDFEINEFDKLTQISVSDDGHGIEYNDAENEFGSLGGSWKKIKCKSKLCKRLLHGRLGKGRFRSFGLGERVEWITTYNDNGNKKKYTIVGRSNRPKEFMISDPKNTNKPTGTKVYIDNLHKNFTSIIGGNAGNEIASFFALYLKQYPDVRIEYDGNTITTEHLEKDANDFNFSIDVDDNGKKADAKLVIIEWNFSTDRYLYLCDQDGFALLDVSVGIHAKGYNFTAYLKSNFIRELQNEGYLELNELHPPLKKLIDKAKDIIREHFRKRSSEEAAFLIKKWQKDRIYPYEGEAKSPVEEAERQVFNICALNLYSYLPEFDHGSDRSKKLSFSLLKTALETNPSDIQRILSDVLELPRSKQNEFANLLKQTSLDSIISASNKVVERMKFLRGLELLLFDDESRKQLLERTQLHKIVADQTWIFGEGFHLTVDDQSLTEVLKKYRNKLKNDVDIVDEVRRVDGRRAIVDLVVGRRLPTPRGDEREHLVVELKRPKVKLNDDHLSQIKSYATAVCLDERFRDVSAKWDFWLISNEMNEDVRIQSNMDGLPPNCILSNKELDLKVWVKTWGQLRCDCEGRLKFFQEQLQYRASRKEALDHLRAEYKKYLPDAFKDKNESKIDETEAAN